MVGIPRPEGIFIVPLAFRKLKMYIGCCPVAIGGLGEVERRADRFVITDLHLLPQRGTPSETELDPQHLCAFLTHCVAQGKDPALLRAWWHSHGKLDVHWSETDHETIRTFPGDYLISIVGNQRGEMLCRLDILVSAPETFQDLPLVPLDEPDAPGDREIEALRQAILAEIREKVRIGLPVDLGELYEWTIVSKSEYDVEGSIDSLPQDQAGV